MAAGPLDLGVAKQILLDAKKKDVNQVQIFPGSVIVPDPGTLLSGCVQ